MTRTTHLWSAPNKKEMPIELRNAEAGTYSPYSVIRLQGQGASALDEKAE